MRTGSCRRRRNRWRPGASRPARAGRCRASSPRRAARRGSPLASRPVSASRHARCWPGARRRSMKGRYQSGVPRRPPPRCAGRHRDPVCARSGRSAATPTGGDTAGSHSRQRSNSDDWPSAGIDRKQLAPDRMRLLPFTHDDRPHRARVALRLSRRAERGVVDVAGERACPARTPRQSGSGGSRISRKRIASASKCSRRPASGSPMPSSSLIASVACSRPITPGSTPSTPASLQLGAASGGGGSGNRQR